MNLSNRYRINVREKQRAINNWQSRDTGNIGYTRHKTQDEDKQSTTQKRKLTRC
jgi:hypothetical protein